MPKFILILFSLPLLFILIFLLLIYKKKYNRATIKNSFLAFIPIPRQQEYNPDINTNSWDLHKKRLMKFGRSKYKGLTFFISSEDRIFYFSEEGTKVYC